MARLIQINSDGSIVTDDPIKPDKAVVRFPTEEEYEQGVDVVPRSIRVEEYRVKNGQ